MAYNPTKETGYTRQDDYSCIAADWETDDAEKFEDCVRKVAASGKYPLIYLIIDEAHEFFPQGSKCATKWMGTRGRHYGLNIIAITQRAAEINVTFRGQCSTIYAFRSNLTDTKFIANEFYHSGVDEKSLALDNGKFIKIQGRSVSFGDIKDF